MLIRYRATKSKREVTEETGRRLVQAGIADEVAPKVKAEQAQPEQRPRRTYRRRDMQAESAMSGSTTNTYTTREAEEE